MISLPAEVTVEWMLQHPDLIPHDAIICMPRREVVADDRCLLIDWRVIDPSDDVTPEAALRGLTSTFSWDPLDQVLNNLAAQADEPSMELKLRALNHYRRTDAFIDLGK